MITDAKEQDVHDNVDTELRCCGCGSDRVVSDGGGRYRCRVCCWAMRLDSTGKLVDWLPMMTAGRGRRRSKYSQ